MLTITIEAGGDGPEIHLHAGGQGFWLARMVHALGVEVRLCGSFGGETGAVARTLIEREGVDVVGVEALHANAAYVHDRRRGGRTVVAETIPPTLTRHELDELYGVTVVEGIEASVCVLGGGTAAGPVVPPSMYRRLAADLTANGCVVIADLAGAALDAVVDGGVMVLKVSVDELVVDGRIAQSSEAALIDVMRGLRARGVQCVVVSRGADSVLAAFEDRVVAVNPPHLEPVEERGGGDSMTAGIAAALARGEGVEAALRLGAAAGALNVTRVGLGSGRRTEIERLARHVQLQSISGTRA
jgi:1-phosphofructokinase